MKHRQEVHAKIVQYVSNHPELTYATIAQKMGIAESTIRTILRAAGYRRNARMEDIDFDALEGK